MHYSVLPPEINSALIFAGAGSDRCWRRRRPGTGWQQLGCCLFRLGDSRAVGRSWQGRSSVAMAAAAARSGGWPRRRQAEQATRPR